MSSILKALKKLENDNATSKPGQVRIDSKILQERSTPGLSRFAVSILAILFVLAGSGTTYFFMKKQETNTHLAPSSTQNSQPQDPLLPPIPVNSIDLQQKQATIPLTIKPGNTSKQPESTKSPAILPEPQSHAVQTAKPETLVQPPETPLQPGIQPKKPMAPATKPVLTVNGIAFQEGSGDNMAVINGTTVTKGSVIEGVKVEEILNDRVRFSQDGERFEIILNRSNR